MNNIVDLEEQIQLHMKNHECPTSINSYFFYGTEYYGDYSITNNGSYFFRSDSDNPKNPERNGLHVSLVKGDPLYAIVAEFHKQSLMAAISDIQEKLSQKERCEHCRYYWGGNHPFWEECTCNDSVHYNTTPATWDTCGHYQSAAATA